MKHVTDINIGGVDIWFGRWSMGGGGILHLLVLTGL